MIKITLTEKNTLTYDEHNYLLENDQKHDIHLITMDDEYTINLDEFENVCPHEIVSFLHKNLQSLSNDLIIGYFTYCQQECKLIPIKEFLELKPRKISENEDEDIRQLLKDKGFTDEQIDYLLSFVLDGVDCSRIVDNYVQKTNKVHWTAFSDTEDIGYVYYFENSGNKD